LEKHPDWTVEPFKTNYSIQFPSYYEGTGMIGFEGNIFQKYTDDNEIRFGYQYCESGVFCEDFGPILQDPIPNSITIDSGQGNLITLDNKLDFCTDNELTGILYYNVDDECHGRFFMRLGDDFLEGLEIEFKVDKIGEVVEIIKTIKMN
jgi:hypothetical protein